MKQKQKVKSFEGWGIMAPPAIIGSSGKLVPCAGRTKREVIKEFRKGLISPWKVWYKRGWRAVKIKIVERD